eukprot:2347864-Rhodomonas_salina.3
MPLTELTSPFAGELGRLKTAAQRGSQNECFLLEFTLTTDFWPTSLDVALIRKHDKVGYVRLLEGVNGCIFIQPPQAATEDPDTVFEVCRQLYGIPSSAS